VPSPRRVWPTRRLSRGSETCQGQFRTIRDVQERRHAGGAVSGAGGAPHCTSRPGVAMVTGARSGIPPRKRVTNLYRVIQLVTGYRVNRPRTDCQVSMGCQSPSRAKTRGLVDQGFRGLAGLGCGLGGFVILMIGCPPPDCARRERTPGRVAANLLQCHVRSLSGLSGRPSARAWCTAFTTAPRS